MPLLEVISATKYFGGLAAVHDMSFEVKSGEILGLIGPNGAGKTTLFNIIAGVYTPTSGNILFKGRDITGRKPNVIIKRGIARTFQHSRLFDNRTVLENMLIAFHLESKLSFWRTMFTNSATREKEMNIRNRAKEILNFVGLKDMEDKHTKDLPHGHRKTLGLAMALATSPELLLLDEPVGGGGMNPEEAEAIMVLLKSLKKKGITILMVEHNLRVVMGLCDRIVVLNFGSKLAEGSPDEIKDHDEVIKAYLGGEADAD